MIGSHKTFRMGLSSSFRSFAEAENIILDLRRCKIPQDKEVKEAEQKLKLSKRLRRMKIVVEGEKILYFSK